MYNEGTCWKAHDIASVSTRYAKQLQSCSFQCLFKLFFFYQNSFIICLPSQDSSVILWEIVHTHTDKEYTNSNHKTEVWSLQVHRYISIQIHKYVFVWTGWEISTRLSQLDSNSPIWGGQAEGHPVDSAGVSIATHLQSYGDNVSLQKIRYILLTQEKLFTFVWDWTESICAEY